MLWKGSLYQHFFNTENKTFIYSIRNFLMILQKESFQRSRLTKYGTIYRTHIFGRPTIVVAGSEYVRKVLLGEGNNFTICMFN